MQVKALLITLQASYNVMDEEGCYEFKKPLHYKANLQPMAVRPERKCEAPKLKDGGRINSEEVFEDARL